MLRSNKSEVSYNEGAECKYKFSKIFDWFCTKFTLSFSKQRLKYISNCVQSRKNQRIWDFSTFLFLYQWKFRILCCKNLKQWEKCLLLLIKKPEFFLTFVSYLLSWTCDQLIAAISIMCFKCNTWTWIFSFVHNKIWYRKKWFHRIYSDSSSRVKVKLYEELWLQSN